MIDNYFVIKQLILATLLLTDFVLIIILFKSTPYSSGHKK